MSKYGYYYWEFDYELFRGMLAVYCAEHKLKYYELDELAGIGHGTTARLINGATNAKMDAWLAIANAVDIDVRTLFKLS